MTMTKTIKRRLLRCAHVVSFWRGADLETRHSLLAVCDEASTYFASKPSFPQPLPKLESKASIHTSSERATTGKMEPCPSVPKSYIVIHKTAIQIVLSLIPPPKTPGNAHATNAQSSTFIIILAIFHSLRNNISNLVVY
jgi:hypothetical protein